MVVCILWQGFPKGRFVMQRPHLGIGDRLYNLVWTGRQPSDRWRGPILMNWESGGLRSR